MNRLTNTSRAAAIVAAVAAFGAAPVSAGDITAEWANVTPPPAPELKQVTVDPKTTALLVLDFGKNNCGVRPRCLANVPNVKKLIDEARTHDMMVAYTLPGQDAAGLVDRSLAPRPGEFLIQGSGGADKFIRSNLDQGLKDKGIKTVIVTGTSAQGAVAGTTNGAAQRGYKAVVPVDGMSSESAFNELYAVWHIAKGGPANLAAPPRGSRFKGYTSFVVQDLVIRPHVVNFRCERWRAPDGGMVTAPLPAGERASGEGDAAVGPPARW